MPHWQSHLLSLPAEWHALVHEAGSLTRALRAVFGRIEVEVLLGARQRPTAEEARALGLAPACSARIREVLLRHGERPLVFARTVMPLTSLQGRNAGLRQLAKAALGDRLFDGRGHRQWVQFSRSSACGGLRDRWCRQLSPSAPVPVGLPQRRSLFVYRQRPLLVQELFLPALLAALSEARTCP